MEKIICTIILSLCGSLLFAQSDLFERRPGVKSITTIEIKGNSTQLDSTVKKSVIFDEQGRLVELDYQYGKIIYEYTNDSTVVSYSSKSPDCKRQYQLSHEEKRSISRVEILGTSTDCSFAPSEPMVFGNVRVDSLFKDVPKTLRKKGREYATTVRTFGETEGEYTDFTYTKRGSQLRLSNISQFQRVSEQYLVQRLFVVAYQDMIILESQQLVDNEQIPIKQLSIDALITELGSESLSKIEYESDDQGNWIVRKPQNMNPERQQYTVRVIEYWD
ncbi:MAG: hypothetical protein AAF927_22090 [Bacteroidota bacterium]